MNKLNAFVLGGTGEVGKEVVKALLADERFARVVSLHRRDLELPADVKGRERLENVKIGLDDVADSFGLFSSFASLMNKIDFDNLDAPEQREKFKGFDVGYCCLGTTRGKAGKEGFIKVDYTYTVGAARAAAAAGVNHYHLCSSRGASASSWLLYPSIKGKAENDISALGFPRFSIYQPGMLLCEREEKRALEAFFMPIVKTLGGTSMSVETVDVAKAMVNNTFKSSTEKVEVIPNAQIIQMAKESPQ